MVIQRVNLFLRIIKNQQRCAHSSANNYFHYSISQNKEYVIVKLNKPPVNSFNLPALNEFNILLNDIEHNSDLKGVILTSNLNKVFTGGVDILEMCKPDTKRLEKFWIAVQDLWITLYGSKKIYIAAINGHALAFGCVIAMSCDYRIMSNSDRLKIGLNATLLGINAPDYFKNTMINTIGQRQAHLALNLGKIFTPSQALKINLVDEVCEEDLVLKEAENRMNYWCKIPTLARQLTKESMRMDTLNKLIKERDSDLKLFIENTTNPILQKNLELYMESLKKRKLKN